MRACVEYKIHMDGYKAININLYYNVTASEDNIHPLKFILYI